MGAHTSAVSTVDNVYGQGVHRFSKKVPPCVMGGHIVSTRNRLVGGRLKLQGSTTNYCAMVRQSSTYQLWPITAKESCTSWSYVLNAFSNIICPSIRSLSKVCVVKIISVSKSGPGAELCELAVQGTYQWGDAQHLCSLAHAPATGRKWGMASQTGDRCEIQL